MQHLRATLPLAFTLLLAACGGGGTTPTPPTEQPPPDLAPPISANLNGTWGGSTTTQSYGTEQTAFTFSQTDTQVSGTLTLTTADAFEADVTGSVNGTSATVSASFALANEGSVTYQYQGTVTDTTFSGTVTLNFSDGAQEVGRFSVTKGSPTTPPPTGPPVNPDVPFYGEWAWSFTRDEGCCDEEGRFSIVEVPASAPAGTGAGYYQECYGATCYDEVEGGVIFGPNEDNELAITVFVLNSANDPVTVYEAVDSDGELSEDDQGRQVFEGEATYYETNYDETARGTFRAILTDLPVAFNP